MIDEDFYAWVEKVRKLAPNERVKPITTQSGRLIGVEIVRQGLGALFPPERGRDPANVPSAHARASIAYAKAKASERLTRAPSSRAELPLRLLLGGGHSHCARRSRVLALEMR